MSKMNVPAAPTLYHTYYKELKGADFSRDRTEVDRKRSPDLLNMISDNGGNPIKRLGWRKVADTSGEKIVDIFHTGGSFYVITASHLFKFNESWVKDDTFTITHTSTNPKGFVFGGNVYFFLGTKIIYIDTSDTSHTIADLTGQYPAGEAKIPRVSISRSPAGKDGTLLEDVNMLTPWQCNTFLGDSTSKDYILSSKKVLSGAEYIKVYVMDSSGEFQLKTYGTDYTLPAAVETTGKGINGASYTFNVCDGKITFKEAHAPVVTGQDNVKVEFISFDEKNGLYKDRKGITNPYDVVTYGYSKEDRVFIVSSSERNKIFYSEVESVAYFPDLNYLTVGNVTADIVGFARMSSYLAVIKEEVSTDSTVFLISGTMVENLTAFQCTPAKAGVGGIAQKSIAMLGDEPLFLSQTGVYGISNYYVSSEYIVRNRSYLLDKKLLKEPNLDKAVAVQWNRHYILCVNSHCYVLDGRNKANDKNNNTDFLYEGYYWEDVPAVCFANIGNELFFGTSDGRICKFNSDVPNITAYCDNGTATIGDAGEILLTDGKAIKCVWSTPLDDDNYPQYFKTLNKKGTLLTLMPYDRTSVKVRIIKDGIEAAALETETFDIFNWTLIDFSRFTFNGNTTAQNDYFNKKIKKYVRLQIILENEGIYEPFGILGITKTYSVGNFSKNRR